NYLDRDEIDFLATHRDRMSVIYCPRTHSFFGHQPYPLAEMLAAGVHVAVGTDSRASNPDLRILKELMHVARHHSGISVADVIRLGTLSAAMALGIEREFGSITIGKRAELCVVRIPTVDPSLDQILNEGSRAQPLSDYLAETGSK